MRTTNTVKVVRLHGIEELKEWSSLTEEEIESLDWESEALVQWIGSPQGLASAAPGFNCHLAHGLNTLLGLDEWTKLALVYTDDLMIIGESNAHAAARQRLMQEVLRALGKKLSSKCDRTIKKFGDHVGMRFTKGGVQLQDEAMESLRGVLMQKPKGKKQMQRILGTVQQAMAAFEFKTCEQTWLADRLAILTQASTTEPHRCTDEVQRTLTKLADRIKNKKN